MNNQTRLVITAELYPCINTDQIIQKIKDVLNKELSPYLSVDSIQEYDEHIFMQQFNDYIPEEYE